MNRHGQSLLEYSIILGVIVIILYNMTPLLKRSVQGMIKIAADQIGTQSNADQDFDEGYMKSSYTSAHDRKQKATREYVGTVAYIYNDLSDTDSSTLSNLGYTPEY